MSRNRSLRDRNTIDRLNQDIDDAMNALIARHLQGNNTDTARDIAKHRPAITDAIVERLRRDYHCTRRAASQRKVPNA